MNASRATLIVSALAVALLGASAARADEPPYELIPTRLGYIVAPGLRKCPSEDLFRALVAVHLYKRDPFTATAGQRVVVELSRVGGQVQALLVLYDAADKSLGQLDPIRAETCSDAVEDVSGMVVPWLLAVGVPAAKPAEVPVAAPPAPPPPQQPDCPKPPPPVVPQPVAAPVRYPDPEPPSEGVPPDPLPGLGVRVGASVLPEQYATGQFSLGFAVDAGIRWRFFSAAVEAHGDPPLGPPPIPGLPFSYARVTGAGLLCLHHDVLVLCGIGEAGRILFSVTPKPIAARSYGAAGIRAGFELRSGDPRFRIRLMGEILAPIDRKSVVFEMQTAYQTAAINGGLVVGLVFAP